MLFKWRKRKFHTTMMLVAAIFEKRNMISIGFCSYCFIDFDKNQLRICTFRRTQLRSQHFDLDERRAKIKRWLLFATGVDFYACWLALNLLPTSICLWPIEHAIERIHWQTNFNIGVVASSIGGYASIYINMVKGCVRSFCFCR